MPQKSFYFLVVDHGRKLFHVSGPMSDDRAITAAVAAEAQASKRHLVGQSVHVDTIDEVVRQAEQTHKGYRRSPDPLV